MGNPRDRISRWTNVAAVNHIHVLPAVAREPSGPAQHVREPVCLAKVKGLAVNLIILCGIELRASFQLHCRHGNLVARVREPAAELDIAPSHSAAVGPVVLRHEQVLHEASGFTKARSSRRFSIRWSYV